MQHSVIVVDDEQDFLESIRRGLITSGYKNVTTIGDSLQAATMFEEGQIYDIALIDITMPGMDGVELLEKIRSHSPTTECLMVTAIDEAKIAVTCLKKGAYDYLVKPISKEDLVLSIERAMERRRLYDIIDLGRMNSVPRLKSPQAFQKIITSSTKIMRILKEAELHAASNVPILITGETGTGKELLARAIHAASNRATNTFTAINMDGISSHLFDAEFFGHTKGAFTGAERDRSGYLETSHQGTLFLDEVGNLPFELQGKLLRVLQEGEFIKIGSSRSQKVDVRFIAATNSNLDQMLAKKQFRRDLYYRLKGGWIHLPPLRERPGDIPYLINWFLVEFNEKSDNYGIDDEALAILSQYDYPGNIRELISILQAAVNLAQGRPITSRYLPAALKKQVKNSVMKTGTSQKIVPLADIERDHIVRVYHQLDQNKSLTARSLGIGLNTLRRKLESYGVG